MERINFASEHFSKDATTGIANTVDADIAAAGGTVPPQELVDACLDRMGAIRITETSRNSLVEHAARDGDLKVNGDGSGRRRIAEMVQLIGATPEFQKG